MKINAERVNYIWKEEVIAVLFDLLLDVPFVNEYDISKGINLICDLVILFVY